MTEAFKRLWPWFLANLCLCVAGGAQGATQVFTDPSLFDHPAVIDFEPLGSGNTLTDINNHLAGLGINATVSFAGGGARIGDLTSSSSATALHVSPGADGGPVSGSWGFEGGNGAASTLTINFAAGSRPQAIGAFWGGLLFTSLGQTIITLDDDNVVSEALLGHLPAVQDTAPDSGAINGFLGIGVSGHTIKSVTFTARNDLYSLDDVTFGSLKSSVVPEPGTFALVGLGLLGLVVARRGRATRSS